MMRVTKHNLGCDVRQPFRNLRVFRGKGGGGEPTATVLNYT
jgi:hypothetical protein